LYSPTTTFESIHTITMGLFGTSDPVKKEEKLIDKGTSLYALAGGVVADKQRQRARRST
jgi:hypothetical protein